MRSIRAWLAAALMLSILAPVGAWAAKGDPAIPKEAIQKGMAAAPALVTAAGSDCDVADARLVGEGTDAKTKAKQAAYEVACKGAEGLVLVKTGDNVQSVSCLQADQPQPDGKPSTLHCLLPENQDPKAGLAPYIAKTQFPCTPEKARAMGQTPDKSFFELACSNNPGGFIMITSAPPRLDKPVLAEPCIMIPETSNLACTLTPRADQLAVVDKLGAASGKPCTIKEGGRGFLGEAQSGKIYYEEACSDGKGYVLVAAPTGAFAEAIPCAAADEILGGCKLTDARQAKTEQASLYTDLAKKAGFDCAVSGYAPLPDYKDLPKDEVVELACSNRPDGGVGFFGATASDPAGVYNCAESELIGYRCVLSKSSAAYPLLTADLKTMGKTTCTVSGFRPVGITPDKKALLEVACSDGLPGYIIGYPFNPPAPMRPVSVLACSESRDCELPTNVKK
jgi:hypothetical protein